ncbi:MAG: YdbH domain-containing protein [Desulfocapsa sp.]|nr:YdbH domain-containing protein [Desulfocapsa sp.]
MRYLTIFVCFLTIGLSLLFVNRLRISEKIIADRLQTIGGTDIQVTVSALNNHELLITSLRSSFSKDAQFQSIQLHDFALVYDLRDLIKGKVAKLDIDVLQLKLNKKKKKGTNSPSFPKDIRSYLPKKISVHNLIISTPEIDGDLTLQLFIQNSRGQPLDIELDINGKNLSLPGWNLAALTGKLFLQTENGTTITLQKDSYIEVKDVQGVTTQLQEAVFLLSGKLTKTRDKGWLAWPATMTVETEGLQLQDLLVQPSSLSLQLKEQLYFSPPVQFHSAIDTSSLLLEWKNKSVPLKDIQIDFVADKHRLQLAILFSHALVPGQIEGSLSHNLLQNKTKALFTMPHPFDLSGEDVNSDQLVKGLPLPFLLTNGLVNCTGTVQWENNKALFINSDFELQNGAGVYKNFTFNGLHIQQGLQLYPAIHTIQPGTVFISELDNGLTVNNIEIHNQIIHTGNDTLPTLLIDSVEAEILGGKVNSKEIRIDPLLQELDLLVQLHGIALDEVINLNKLNGLSVTGIMDGSIRLQMKNGQFSIPEGELHSRQPGGVISYHPPEGSKELPQLPAYAMKALREFNYDILTATPRYKSDGTLNIAIHTEGNSPPLNTTRPVHLNLTTEQNILSLLQSLRYSKRLTDDLEQRLRTRRFKD